MSETRAATAPAPAAARVWFATAPPEGWETAIRYPVQGVVMAEAMRALGYIPYYVRDADKTALVQIRDPLGRGGSPLARAFVYPAGEDREFLAAITAELRRRGVPFARFGNTMWGMEREESAALPGATVITRHTFRIDLTPPEDEILRRMRGAERRIRKAQKSGVEAGPCASDEEMAAFLDLYRETNVRIREADGSIATFPRAFFRRLFAPNEAPGAPPALLVVARYQGRVVAGNIFLSHGDTMLYFIGASSRDRALRQLEAPALSIWRAMCLAREYGLRTFDIGGCTPGLPEGDSRRGVYEFKKRFGGDEAVFYNAEVVLSPFWHGLQERFGKKLWNVFHPLYFWLRTRWTGNG